jgi:hypothetical protein
MVPAVAALLAAVLALVPLSQKANRAPAPLQQATGVHQTVPSVVTVAKVEVPRKHHFEVQHHFPRRDDDKQLVTLNSQLEKDSKAAIPEIVELVEGDTPQMTKERALYVLAHSKSVEAHQTLLTIAQESANPTIQAQAIRIVGVVGNTDKKQTANSVFLNGDAEVLARVLQSQPDKNVRVETIRSLAVLGDRSQALLNTYRSDTNADVRRAVLDALAAQKNAEALWTLANEEMNASWKKEIMDRLAGVSGNATLKPAATFSPEP